MYFPKLNEYHKFLEVKNGRIYCQTLNGQGDEELELQDYFKVISKVPPDAVWVERGMEFDESEVKQVKKVHL